MKSKAHKKTFTFLTAFCTFIAKFAFVGVETTASAGRDLEAAGEAIESAADDAQNY